MKINKVRTPKAPMPKIIDLAFGAAFSINGIDYLRYDGGALQLSGTRCYEPIDCLDHREFFDQRPDTLWNVEMNLHD